MKLPGQRESAPALSPPVSDQRDHVLGARESSVELVEYGDYASESSKRAHGVVKQLLERSGESLCFVFRSFPALRAPELRADPRAELAARAAHAAAGQGRFFEMHDALMEHEGELDVAGVLACAREAGLEPARFAAELLSPASLALVRDDFLSGLRSGVRATPTFFVGGERLEGRWDFATLAAAIDERARRVLPRAPAPGRPR